MGLLDSLKSLFAGGGSTDPPSAQETYRVREIEKAYIEMWHRYKNVSDPEYLKGVS